MRRHTRHLGIFAGVSQLAYRVSAVNLAAQSDIAVKWHFRYRNQQRRVSRRNALKSEKSSAASKKYELLRKIKCETKCSGGIITYAPLG